MASINLKYPLRSSPRGAFATNDTTIDAIRDDLRILLLTNYGERPIHYDFGANLRSAIFEQDVDMPQKVKDLISSAVEKWMPFVNILELVVHNYKTDPVVAPNQIYISVKFSVNGVVAELQQSIAT